MLEKALAFAKAKHAGQVRKYSGEPYISHPMAVATMVAEAGGTDAMIAAAILHDVLEDTDTAEAEVLARFGPEITKLVTELTNIYRAGTGGNRAERKRKELVRLAGISPEAQTVKVADLIHNTISILSQDPKFARVFVPEVRALHAVLTEANPALRTRLGALLDTTPWKPTPLAH